MSWQMQPLEEEEHIPWESDCSARLPLCMGVMTNSLWLGKERSMQIPQTHTHKLET